MSPSQVPETQIFHDTTTVARHATDELLIDRRSLSEHQQSVIEELAFQYGSVPESYDIAVSHGHVLPTPCGRGVMSVLADGRFWHIAGGMLAPRDLRPQLIHWLRDVSSNHNRTIAVYNVSRTDAEQFRDEGFVVNKFGEEPVLDPRQVDWCGKQFEWIRRQSNFCVRAGIEIAEVKDSDERQQLAETLVSIMSDDLFGRTFDRPLRLLEGEFVPHTLRRRRLFVARSETDGHVEAFLACSPIDGGRGWAFETYRKRKNATRGITAFLFRTVIDRLRNEGTEKISLCLIPGRNVTQCSIGEGDWRVEKALSLWFNQLNFLFNTKGQDHFKSRFRPRYVDRYICVAPHSSMRSLWSFLKTTGATNGNWWNMLRQLRKSVSEPP